MQVLGISSNGPDSAREQLEALRSGDGKPSGETASNNKESDKESKESTNKESNNKE
jgi:hypothetical protein